MKQMLFTSKQNKRWGSEGRGDQKSFLQTDLQKRGIFKWFQLLLYKNILWATFRRRACFMPLKGFPSQMASWNWWCDFYPLGCLGRTLFKTMQHNPNKAQSWFGHKETGLPPPAPAPPPKKIPCKPHTNPSEFLSGAGKRLIFFYRTGCEKSFLAEFLFYNQNNSREVKWLFLLSFPPPSFSWSK